MFKSFDFFPKVLEDQPFKKTVCGGMLFVVTFITIFALIFNELYLTFIQGELIMHQYVDTSHVDDRIRVNLNISFHKVPCMALALDLQDVTGTHLEDVQHTIHKLKMNQQGEYLDSMNAEKVKRFEHYINYPSNPLFRLVKKLTDTSQDIEDCYGAQLYDGQKCITCQDVMAVYAARNWPQPPKEAVAQCMPDHKASIKKQPQQQQVFIHQHPNGVQHQHVQMTDQPNAPTTPQAKERRLFQESNQEIDQLLGHQKQDPNSETNKLTNDITKYENLTPEEHTKLFMKRLKELNQIKSEPVNYDAQMNKDEKDSRVQGLIDMMDVDFNEFDQRMQHQIAWQLHDKVVFAQNLMKLDQQQKQKWINITQISRRKCDQDLVVHMKLKGASIDELLINMTLGQCESILMYRVVEIGSINKIQLQFDQQIFDWNFQFDREHHYQTLEFEITAIDGASYKLFDSSSPPSFRFQIVEDKNRKLFSEDFGHEQPKQQIIYMQDLAQISQHLNEGCQVYGHFFIRKVPGNFHISFHGKGQAALFLTQQFSIEHTIHLLEFTEEKQELTLGGYIKSTNPLDGVKQLNELEQDSQYYLKIVGGKYNPLWTSESKLFTFTSHESKKKSDGRLPQIEFKYEFDAITMIYSSRSQSIFHFLVSLLAIIGGVFSVSNLVSSVLEKIGV